MTEASARHLDDRRYVRGHRTDEAGKVYHVRTSTENGEPWFSRSECADILVESLFKWRSQLDFRLFAFVVMPEHVHILLMPTEAAGLRKILMNLKRHSAWRINQFLGRTGRFWRDEFFDHWMRNKAQAARTVEYLHNNPVRRQLVERPEDYAYSSWHAWYQPQECSYQLDLGWW